MMNMRMSIPVNYLGVFMSSSVIFIKIREGKKKKTLIVSTFIISKVTCCSGASPGICSAPAARLFAASALTFA